MKSSQATLRASQTTPLPSGTFCATGARMRSELAWIMVAASAVRHVPLLLRLERLDCIQWIQGAGSPLPSQWLDLLRRIQAGGKSVQLYYGESHGADADLKRELDILCRALDPKRLFIWATLKSVQEAEDIVRFCRKEFRNLRPR